MLPALLFFLRIALTILGLSWLHMNFRVICPSSLRSVMGDLTGIALNPWLALGHVAI